MSDFGPLNETDLWRIRDLSDTALDMVRDALSGMLITDDDYRDATDARAALIRVQNAIRELRCHLVNSYEFRNGGVELKKEGLCTD